jgi:hypothetical protein
MRDVELLVKHVEAVYFPRATFFALVGLEKQAGVAGLADSLLCSPPLLWNGNGPSMARLVGSTSRLFCWRASRWVAQSLPTSVREKVSRSLRNCSFALGAAFCAGILGIGAALLVRETDSSGKVGAKILAVPNKNIDLSLRSSPSCTSQRC